MSKNKQVVALLPIKIHSDRVPSRDFEDFRGKPLFRWVLDTLLGVDCVRNIVINTDATSLLKDQLEGADPRIVLKARPYHLVGEFVSMNKIVEDDVVGLPDEHFLMTHATNPLLSTNTIKEAIRAYFDALEAGTHDSLFSVNKVQARFYRESGIAVNHNPNQLTRTFDLEPWYEENSMLYVFSKTSFQSTNARIGKAPILFESPLVELTNMTSEQGWQLAEMNSIARRL